MHIAGKYLDFGLLLLRVGLGVLYIMEGFPVLFGGPEEWDQYGRIFYFADFTSAPTVFGFLFSMVQFFGGIFLILGLYMKPILFLFAFVLVATTFNFAGQGAPLSTYAHPLKMALVFFSLLFIGPGKISIDYRLSRHQMR